MSARTLILGLDGADLDVMERIGRTQLPTLFSLMERGAYARLESVQPPATLPNWTTFLTGLDPGEHGVFDFTLREGYRVRFTAGTIREAPTFLSRLDRMGFRCACVGFPATWPPEPLANGVFISGWDSPVAFEADRSFVWPHSLYDAIVDRFGNPRFDDVDEFDADRPGWHDALAPSLEARIARKTDLCAWLLERESWDVAAFYFGESDTAAHHLMSLFDPRSPRHHGAIGASARDALPRVYRALDRAVGALIDRAGPDVEITILSDHGSGPSSDKVLYLNRALEAAGLLRFRSRGLSSAAFSLAKDAALVRLPAALRQGLFSLAGRALPGIVESNARFGDIDWSGTVAFSEELNYFPSVSFNLRGREPRGVVSPREIDVLRARVIDALLAIEDPWSKQKVVDEVWPRETQFVGPFLDRAPDLLLSLRLDRGATYNVMPSGTAPRGTGAFRRLSPEEYLGRKGRSLPGSHRPRGLFVAAGPSVRPVGELEAHIADVTPTLLARLGIAPPKEMRGRVLREALRSRSADRTLAEAPARSPFDAGDRTRLEARLRALGYLD